MTRQSPGQGHSSADSGSEVVLADLVEELAAADPQPLGGPGPVPVAGEQGSADRPPLDLGQEGAEGEFLGRVAGRGEVRVGGLVGLEVLGEDRPAPGGDRGAGQGVLELADVPRPGVRRRITARASGESDRPAQPYFRSRRRRMCSASGAMSSGRSRSGGMAIRTTLSR